MKICYLNYDYPPKVGGIATLASSLIKYIAMDNQIEKIKVFSFANPNPRVEKQEKIFIHTQKEKSFLKIGLYTLKYINKNKDFDIFHATDFFPVGFWMVFFARVFNKKTAVNIHGTDALTREGRAITKLFKRYIVRKVDIIFVNSNSTANRVANFYNVKKDKIKVVFAGINDEIKKNKYKNIRGKYGFEENDFVVLSVGRLVKRKGVDDIIKAINEIVDRNVKLLVVGDGPDKSRLEKLINQLEINDRVEFTGKVKDVSDYYYSADIFCLTSKHRKEVNDIEGLGIVNIEAQYFGLPIVCTNSGGIPETIIPDKTGFLELEGDYKAIAEKILLLKTNSELRQRFSHRAHEYVREKFNWQKISSNYIKNYQAVLNE